MTATPPSEAQNEARAEILGRMREALRDRPAPPPVAPLPERAPLGHDALVDLFAERVSEYRATVQRSTPQELANVIAAVLDRWGARRIVVPAGVPAHWLSATNVDAVADDPPLSHDQLDALDGVITSCAAGIAESGTIVLDATAGQGRRALSLLPDRHLCVIHAEQVVRDVPDALPVLNPRRPLTWISGPSATSDIELQRVEGVHGPRVLDVIIVVPEVDSRARPADRPAHQGEGLTLGATQE
jgi:L-lactate dehydrogenase complex protein LldG